MGFNSWPRGGDAWNIRNDPLAFKIILESSAPIAVGDTEVCSTHLNLDVETARRMLGGHGEVGNWLVELLQAFISKYDALTSRAVGPHQWVIWDDIVIADMLGFTETRVFPRPDLNTRDLTFVPHQSDKTIDWITEVDQRRIWADFVTKLDKHIASLLPRR
jgi:inosine-uridine nucleoside N-ribohydrolase